MPIVAEVEFMHPIRHVCPSPGMHVYFLVWPSHGNEQRSAACTTSGSSTSPIAPWLSLSRYIQGARLLITDVETHPVVCRVPLGVLIRPHFDGFQGWLEPCITAIVSTPNTTTPADATELLGRPLAKRRFKVSRACMRGDDGGQEGGAGRRGGGCRTWVALLWKSPSHFENQLRFIAAWHAPSNRTMGTSRSARRAIESRTARAIDIRSWEGLARPVSTTASTCLGAKRA
mmetsp:Transcript_36274/g.120082  ORF Transcript_36274/g.120082 Transcript_36274/m.120082 type:complete len:230 (+) Transcript_36274:451-1140(+)